jgi:hypothetical protein
MPTKANVIAPAFEVMTSELPFVCLRSATSALFLIRNKNLDSTLVAARISIEKSGRRIERFNHQNYSSPEGRSAKMPAAFFR